MEKYVNMDMLIIVLSAMAAAGSFIAVMLPILNRKEKKERVKAVIEKKRKVLFEQTREDMKKGNKTDEKGLSASESVLITFKMRKLLGDMSINLRNKMLQAGYRNPNAPVKFIAAQIILPVFLVLLSMMVLGKARTTHDINGGMTMLILLGAAGIGYSLPKVLLKNQIQKRSQEINMAFPDALDMMLICVQGGIGLEQTVNRIAEEVSEHSPLLAEELGILSAEMAMLNDRRGALQDFARRVGSGAAKSFATALIQAEQYGTSVTQAMRTMSDEIREQRMAAAEQKAASLPPKLTVPMILFFLPVLFVIILVPAVMQAKANMAGHSLTR
ncbi:MAG: Type secretion protein [Micavibrio sp.]|nr:Type secretion protein [Micavibrio sp.]